MLAAENLVPAAGQHPDPIFGVENLPADGDVWGRTMRWLLGPLEKGKRTRFENAILEARKRSARGINELSR